VKTVLRILNQKKSELLHCFDGIRSILFEEDDSIQPGGCLIETNQGDIDARLESQVRVIEGDIRKVTDSGRQG
jgi:flagellar assembly protein FliH